MNPPKVFISYSHKDKEMVTRFVNFIKPLKQRSSIEIYWDSNNQPGSRFLELIDKHLNASDIVLFCMSPDFLQSDACRDEVKKIKNLKQQRFIETIPIVLNHCPWTDVSDKTSLKDCLALPEDGKPVSSFSDETEAWNQVYHGITKLSEQRKLWDECNITPKFVDYLEDSGLFPQNINRQSPLKLSEIYVSPKLRRFDVIYDDPEEIDANDILHNLRNKSKFLISGQPQSGKTSIAKTFFKTLREKGFLPIYVIPEGIQTLGNLPAVVSHSLKFQYSKIPISVDEIINSERTVLIIDDFQNITANSKMLSELDKVAHVIVFSRDAVVLELRNKHFVDFSKYELHEWRATKRSELITKWLNVANGEPLTGNAYFTQLDEKTEIVESTLGKVLSNGIMPAFPYYILAIVAMQDAFTTPLDQEVTSQGYCYQWLIVTCLVKVNVKPNDIDTYLNVLASMAYRLFETDKGTTGFNDDELVEFFEEYSREFNFYIPRKDLLSRLARANIFKGSNAGFFSFTDKYLFFFFTAKHIADHLANKKPVIDSLLNKIHINQSAYILIFIAHHTKNINFIQSIQSFADKLFVGITPCRLDESDVSVFAERITLIEEKTLSTADTSPTETREKQLEAQDKIEALHEKRADPDEVDPDDPTLEIRQFIRISETLGRIAKNRAGSFTQPELKSLIKTEIDLHARIMSTHFSMISDPQAEKFFVSFFDKLIQHFQAEKGDTQPLTTEKRNQLAKRLFWNLNYYFTLALIGHCANSIGSKKLRKITDEVCDNENSPFSSLVKQVVHLWKLKEVDVKTLLSIHNKMIDFNKRLLKHFIIRYCKAHHLDYKDRQKLIQGLGIKANKLPPIK